MLNKILSTVLVVAVVAVMVIGVGCAALSDYVTPATIDQRAVDYVVKAQVADANDFGGYANLCKARKLEIQVKAAHEVNMLALEYAVNGEKLTADLLNGIVARNRVEATELEAAIFDPATGLLAAGLGVFGLSAGGLLGLFRKRPGDWEPTKVEAALAEVGVKVSEKDRQFAEVVKNVQQFKAACKKSGDPNLLGAVELLKSFLVTQSGGTATAVTTAKHT